MEFMLTVLSVFSTRPEAIKMAPVVWELAKHRDCVRSVVCVMARHRYDGGCEFGCLLSSDQSCLKRQG